MRGCRDRQYQLYRNSYVTSINYTIENDSLVHFNAAINLPDKPVTSKIPDGSSDDEEGERHNGHVS